MEKSEKLKAQLVIITGLLVLYFIFNATAFIYSATILGVLFLVIPKTGDWIVWLWFKIAEILGWINSRILLTLIFYLFLVPVAFVYRFFNKDPLSLKPGGRKTMFKTRNHSYKKEDLENMW